jgi:hypothetical protein
VDLSKVEDYVEIKVMRSRQIVPRLIQFRDYGIEFFQNPSNYWAMALCMNIFLAGFLFWVGYQYYEFMTEENAKKREPDTEVTKIKPNSSDIIIENSVIAKSDKTSVPVYPVVGSRSDPGYPVSGFPVSGYSVPGYPVDTVDTFFSSLPADKKESIKAALLPELQKEKSEKSEKSEGGLTN